MSLRPRIIEIKLAHQISYRVGGGIQRIQPFKHGQIPWFRVHYAKGGYKEVNGSYVKEVEYE